MDKLLRLKQTIIRRVEITPGTDNSGLLLKLKSRMTVKKSGIGKIITTRATAKWPLEPQLVQKNHSFRSNTASTLSRPNPARRSRSQSQQEAENGKQKERFFYEMEGLNTEAFFCPDEKYRFS